MNDIILFPAQKATMSVTQRLQYELKKNSNILFGYKYLMSDDADELFIMDTKKNIGYHAFYLPECIKIIVKPSYIILIDNEGCFAVLSKKGLDYKIKRLAVTSQN